MIEIRRLTRNDAEGLWRLRMESLREAPLAFGEHWEEHARMTVETMAARLDQQESFVYGAFDGEKQIGMGGFYRNQQKNRLHKGHIWGVYVQPAYRGQGISRRLMTALIGEAKRLPGLEQILLSVTQPEARALYLSLGFWPYGMDRRALIVNGQSVDEELMSLSL